MMVYKIPLSVQTITSTDNSNTTVLGPSELPLFQQKKNDIPIDAIVNVLL